MNKKIIWILSLLMILLTNTSVIAYSTEELEAANSLAERWIINDHTSDPENYNLDSNVLRQEIAAVARWVAWLEKKATCDNIFSDVSATIPNTWICYNVEPLVDNDLIASNDTFRPEDNITKSEAIAMLIKAIWFDYSYDSTSTKWWQEQIVDYAAEMWIVDNFTDYNTDASRWWIFVVANTTIEKDEEIKKEQEEQENYSDEVLLELESILSVVK